MVVHPLAIQQDSLAYVGLRAQSSTAQLPCMPAKGPSTNGPPTRWYLSSVDTLQRLYQ
jgi:hypothetical protein